ncbi:hypothetical protein TSAR_010222 [Trichomalopsis sarcophagae]|uniref:Uncharacterized protein n=1 Tax=Trichomalopsis sarcophagae TaxID=543379 RepID=A0A232FMJ6_9HYME|nr:hypothetical protein TSAR_010222 [Trichomalopsis sarcophagae]
MLSEYKKAYGRRSETGWTLWIMQCQTHPTFISLLKAIYRRLLSRFKRFKKGQGALEKS